MGCGASVAGPTAEEQRWPKYSPALGLLEKAKHDPAQKELVQIFVAFDVNADGLIGMEDFSKGLLSLGQRLTEQETCDIIETFDEDGDGMLDIDEFSKALKNCADDIAPLEASPFRRGGRYGLSSRGCRLLGPLRGDNRQDTDADGLSDHSSEEEEWV
eukprot:TRINITY_DN26163_c0_g1_i1.p1 TRINITY_DN26163_c0_g1~~TRINITY_DN26163_c0_g1_i1.p1  ORF type:complete len:158 (+),score=35.81 TRINITY_DN26163_c0_g1_i1:116-589(+)